MTAIVTTNERVRLATLRRKPRIISIYQPWAHCIQQNGMDVIYIHRPYIDIRKGQWLLIRPICSEAKSDSYGWRWLEQTKGIKLPKFSEMDKGVIAIAQFKRFAPASNSPWSQGAPCWEIENVKPIAPGIQCKVQMSVYDSKVLGKIERYFNGEVRGRAVFE